jgi:hypothetical protein
VTHIAVATFFTAALLGALVAIHLTMQHYWPEILLALRGELGLDVSDRARKRISSHALRQRAAF